MATPLWRSLSRDSLISDWPSALAWICVERLSLFSSPRHPYLRQPTSIKRQLFQTEDPDLVKIWRASK